MALYTVGGASPINRDSEQLAPPEELNDSGKLLGRVDILLLLSQETLKSLEKLPETEFFSKLGFFSGVLRQ